MRPDAAFPQLCLLSVIPLRQVVANQHHQPLGIRLRKCEISLSYEAKGIFPTNSMKGLPAHSSFNVECGVAIKMDHKIALLTAVDSRRQHDLPSLQDDCSFR
jgi:hypothetical protein